MLYRGLLVAIALSLCFLIPVRAQDPPKDDPPAADQAKGTVHVFRLKSNRDTASAVTRPPARTESKAKMTIVGRPDGKIHILQSDGEVEVIREHALPRIERSPEAQFVPADPDNAALPERRRLRQKLERDGARGDSGERPVHTPPPPARTRSPR